jgi:hypothetical protein
MSFEQAAEFEWSEVDISDTIIDVMRRYPARGMVGLARTLLQTRWTLVQIASVHL